MIPRSGKNGGKKTDTNTQLKMQIKINKKSVFLFSSGFICVFLLLLFFILHSYQSKPTHITTNPASGWSSFTSAGQYITAITWDKDNNLWVAGEEFGVSIVNEKAIKTFDIPYCYTILCDKTGKVWIGTLRQGLYCYDNGKWTNYNISNGLPSNTVHALAIDKGNNLYCALGLSLVRQSYGKWEKIPIPTTISTPNNYNNLPNSEISCMDFDNEGNLWVGFALGGVAKFNGYAWKLYTQKDDLDIDGRVNDILVDKTGTIWVATCNGIARSTYYTGRQDISFTVDKFEPFHKGYSEQEDPMGWSYYPANYFTSIAQYDENNILLVNRHDPVRRWNIHDSRFMPFTSPEQLPSQQQLLSRNYFYCITVDKDSYIWMGSYGGGIITTNPSFKFPRKTIKSKVSIENEIPSVKFSEQIEQPASLLSHQGGKELIAKAYNLLKDSPSKEQAYYIGEDWLTRGDWIGNYGEYAWILPAYYADDNALNLFGGSDRIELYSFGHLLFRPYIGENRTPDDALRGWAILEGEIDYGEWENPRVLKDPLGGGRHNAAWDDHAESYFSPLLHEGPHIYLDLAILEEGIFTVSFYFMNNDSYEDDPMNKFRDYTISVKKKTFSEKQFEKDLLLASYRVYNFRAGVYKSFLLKGPGEYTIKLDKKESFNTMIWGIFVDKVKEEGNFSDL